MAGKLMQALWYDSYGGGASGLKVVSLFIYFFMLRFLFYCVQIFDVVHDILSLIS